jgi:hypothetical protein
MDTPVEPSGFLQDQHGNHSSKRLYGFVAGLALIVLIGADQFTQFKANLGALSYLAMLCGGCFGLAQMEWFAPRTGVPKA